MVTLWTQLFSAKGSGGKSYFCCSKGGAIHKLAQQTIMDHSVVRGTDIIKSKFSKNTETLTKKLFGATFKRNKQYDQKHVGQLRRELNHIATAISQLART